MSKLAHSHQPTMDEIDRRRAIENGDEDLLPKQDTTTEALRAAEPILSQCEQQSPGGGWFCSFCGAKAGYHRNIAHLEPCPLGLVRAALEGK